MKERENSRVSIGNDDEQDLRIDLPLLVSADSCRLQERERSEIPFEWLMGGRSLRMVIPGKEEGKGKRKRVREEVTRVLFAIPSQLTFSLANFHESDYKVLDIDLKYARSHVENGP